jgi:heat-inducible transcriptional repressor
MILNDRKIKILEAIINDYVATAEPIGSRTIAKKYNLGISSATIRNEMSDLEELGLIVQPHTSAGRVPSDKGYRLYVDHLMHSRELTGDEVKVLKETITRNVDHIDYLMKQTAKALSMLTSYTTVVTEPKGREVKVKHIQLVPVDEHSVVCVVVTDTKVIKNHVLRCNQAPDMDELNRLSAMFNLLIEKCDVTSLKDDELNAVLDNFGEFRALAEGVVKAIDKTVAEEEDVQFYASGVNNILEFPEFNDVVKAKNFLQAFEEKDMLITLLGKDMAGNPDKIQIVIGGESNMEGLKDCSIVRANYRYGKNSYGTIGVIGPTRMNYSQTVSILNAIVKNISGVIKALEDGESGG